MRATEVPGLRPGVVFTHDRVRGGDALLFPEGVLLLNETAADVVRLCDGVRTVQEIAADLGRDYDDVPVSAVVDLLDDLVRRRLVTAGGRGVFAGPAARPVADAPPDPVPVGMLAELTYRCPLQCFYCSNPVQTAGYRDELSRAQWLGVLDQAAALGVLQLHLSGGEPLLRRDLVDLVAHASALGLYTNLITSGIPLAEGRMEALAEAGLSHVQLSVQDSDPASARHIAGLDAIERKRAAAARVRACGLPLTVNVVLHALNADRVLDIAAQAVALGASRLELAHTQFYGWGLRNRAALMPSAAQVSRAAAQAGEVQRRYGDTLEIVYVQPDLHTRTPKPCMQGWGSRQLVVAPNGDVLPCLAAAQLPGMTVENVGTRSLADIWYRSASFNRFRGTHWMPEPCQSCALRDIDLGGCRCQAYQLTGDPAATDPVCSLSPDHGTIDDILAGTGPVPPLQPRRFP
ncbi:pyrroloquinoline quinone biosynthesis protein PqqE [Winogradskya humida]|uniref:PqqA peptide cyclase n=1 Tax=Winogradskya humida TaxID=113566 RepID=A0ABQ3ZXG6_9ACTN|nr:pyrroloquinoline quinone biosynthesis protein PqqE [Actinoplanes humidus]GIE23199.1 hypothetical protein Ahu01nite_063010 [Actinoplanes humidus]